MLFKKNLKELNRKPNEVLVHEGNEFYNSLMKSWIEKNNIKMYSMYYEGKCIIAETFIKTLKNKMYEYMTSISKMCILIN